MTNDALRKIYFYRIDCGLDDETLQPVLFKSAAVLNHLNSLDFTETGRYQSISDEVDLCAWADGTKPRARLRLGNIRRKSMPSVELRGDVTMLDLPPGAGITEFIHIIFFGNNVFGADFNFFGPRASRLHPYLLEKAPGQCGRIFGIDYLIRSDPWAQIDRMTDIKWLTLRVSKGAVPSVGEAVESLGPLLNGMIEAGSAEYVDIIWRVKPYSRNSLGRSMIQMLRSFKRHPDAVAATSKFVVQGFNAETESVEVVDVLKQHFVVSRRIPYSDQEHKVLDTDSAYFAINDAYNEIKGDLKDAVGVRPV